MECYNGSNDSASMVVRFHLIRHGYAEHNQGKDTYGSRAYFSSKYKFSKLLPQGEESAMKLRSKILNANMRFDRIYTSPLDRAMQTTKIIFDSSIADRNEIMVTDYLRELNYSHPCNERRTVSHLQAMYPRFDYSLMRSDHDILFTYGDMENRFMSMLCEIKRYAEWWYNEVGNETPPNIALVSHESFLLEFANHYLTKNLMSIDNCEIVTINIDIGQIFDINR